MSGVKTGCLHIRFLVTALFCTIVGITLIGLGTTVAVYVLWTGTEDVIYRGWTSARAVYALSRLSNEDVENFIKSYEVFTKDSIDTETKLNPDDKYSIDEQHIVN